MSPRLLDQILLGTALAAALGSLAVYRWPGWGRGRSSPVSQDRVRHAAGYVPAVVEAPAAARPQWLPPAAQSRGPEWVYDVFTPPVIAYDAKTGHFAVMAPPGLDGPLAEADEAGIELVAVQREPCGLQLLGFVGGEGHYLGAFENVPTGEVILAGAGRKVPDLGLSIQQFGVERRPVTMTDGSPSQQRIATAVVCDERSGACTTLTAGECSYTGELRAIVAAEDAEDEAPQALRKGEEFRGWGKCYVLERVQLDPPTAELAQVAPATPRPVRVRLAAKVAPDSPTAMPAH